LAKLVGQAPRWRSGNRVDQDRFGISDAMWAEIAPPLPGKSSDGGVTARDNRLFLDAALWRVRGWLGAAEHR
jgi:hypothetical protein